MARYFNYLLSIITLVGGLPGEICCRIIGGQVKPEIEMPLSATILSLKERIQEHLHVEVARQTLLFEGKWLTNEDTIESYDFQHFTILTLYVASLPGEQKFNISVKYDSMEGNFRVKQTCKVDQLKRKIEKSWAIPSSTITLIHLFTEMEDDLHLFEYYVYEGSEVEMRINI